MERKELKKDRGSASVTKDSKPDTNLSKIAAYNSVTTMQYNDDMDDILELYGCKLTATPKAKRLRSPESEQDISDVNKIRAVESPFSPAIYSPRTATPSRLSSTQASNRGKVLLKFGADLASWKNENAGRETVVKKSEDQSHVPAKALYMYEKLSNKAEALDAFCEELGTILCAATNATDNIELDQVSAFSRSQHQLQSYGRICCDAAEGKLNAASVLLEGTRRLSSGVRIQLDLRRLNQYSIFPGQIVAVKGVNPTGRSLVVQNLFFESPPPIPKPPELKDGDLQLVFAAGPFTQSDNLAYEPLLELIQYTVENEPHILILVGPFVEFNHQDIQECNMSSTFDEFFEQCVRNIMEGLKGTSTQVILIPSHRDVHHDPVYPTPEFKVKNKYPNLHLMPDPCMIDIEGLIIGTTSVDTLMDLGREEISFNAQKFDRLTRLATHVLAQRCFYPLAPPSEEVNVDSDLWQKYALMQQRPHILFLPSSLRYFCKNIYDCLVVNPERLAKGSFARLRIAAPSRDKSPWNTTDNVAVQILKL